MKKIRAGAAAGTAAIAVIFGAGSANADNEYKGITYAQAKVQTAGSAVIVSRIGEYLPTDQCVVTGSRFGNIAGVKKVLVSLNCNAPTALAGRPGGSAATPEGKVAAQNWKTAQELSGDYAAKVEAGETPVCLRDENTNYYCSKICKRSGACSSELLDVLDFLDQV